MKAIKTLILGALVVMALPASAEQTSGNWWSQMFNNAKGEANGNQQSAGRANFSMDFSAEGGTSGDMSAKANGNNSLDSTGNVRNKDK